MPKVTYTDEFKRKMLELYRENGSLRKTAAIAGVERNTLAEWARRDKQKKARDNPAAYGQPLIVAVSESMRQLARAEKKAKQRAAGRELCDLQGQKEELASTAAALLQRRMDLAATLPVEEGLELVSNRDLVTLVKDLLPKPREEEPPTAMEEDEEAASLFEAYTTGNLAEKN